MKMVSYKKLILKGVPQSTNNLYKANCVSGYPRIYMTADGKATKQSYQYQAKVQWKDRVLEGDLEVEINLYFKDKRRRDWDNYSKILADSLEGIVFIDDKQIQKATVIKNIDRENPRIEIKIYER